MRSALSIDLAIAVARGGDRADHLAGYAISGLLAIIVLLICGVSLAAGSPRRDARRLAVRAPAARAVRRERAAPAEMRSRRGDERRSLAPAAAAWHALAVGYAGRLRAKGSPPRSHRLCSASGFGHLAGSSRAH